MSGDRGDEARMNEDSAVADVRLEVLVSAEGDGSLDTLLDALGDADWRIRRAAASAVTGHRAEDILTALFDMLSSEDAGERNAAIKAFIKIGSPAVHTLAQGLASPDPDVRNFCALALGQVGDRTAVRKLIDALRAEEDVNVVYMIIEALGRLGDPAALPCLVGALESELWQRAAAADALGLIGSRAAVPALLVWAGDDVVGGVVAGALGRIRDLRALLPLVRTSIAAPGPRAATYVDALGALLADLGQTDALLAGKIRALLTAEEVDAFRTTLAEVLREESSRAAVMAVADWFDDGVLAAELLPHLTREPACEAAVSLIARHFAELRPAIRPSLAALRSDARRVLADLARTAG